MEDLRDTSSVGVHPVVCVVGIALVDILHPLLACFLRLYKSEQNDGWDEQVHLSSLLQEKAFPILSFAELLKA